MRQHMARWRALDDELHQADLEALWRTGGFDGREVWTAYFNEADDVRIGRACAADVAAHIVGLHNTAVMRAVEDVVARTHGGGSAA